MLLKNSKSLRHSFVKSAGSESLKSLMTNKQQERFTVFHEQIAPVALHSFPLGHKKTEKLSKQEERFAQIMSKSLTSLFLKSHESDLLTLLFCKERHQLNAHSCSLNWAIWAKEQRAKERRAKEHITNPGSYQFRTQDKRRKFADHSCDRFLELYVEIFFMTVFNNNTFSAPPFVPCVRRPVCPPSPTSAQVKKNGFLIFMKFTVICTVASGPRWSIETVGIFSISFWLLR